MVNIIFSQISLVTPPLIPFWKICWVVVETYIEMLGVTLDTLRRSG